MIPRSARSALARAARLQCGRSWVPVRRGAATAIAEPTKVKLIAKAGFARKPTAAFHAEDSVVHAAVANAWNTYNESAPTPSESSLLWVGACNAALTCLHTRSGAAVHAPDAIFATPAHDWMISTLFQKCQQLTRGDFNGNNGQGSTAAFIGSRGNGKSTVLVAMLQVLAALFPTVHTVCINSEKIMASGRGIIAYATGLLAQEHPAYRDVVDDGQLQETLLERDESLVLVIDELDVLYQSTGTHRLLLELSSLGDGTSGRIVVLLCGSHPALYKLITTAARNSEMQDIFPALKVDAVDLNNTKYHPLYLPVAHLADGAQAEAAVRAIIDGSGWKSVPDTAVRAVLFLVGARARLVQAALKDTFVTSGGVKQESLVSLGSADGRAARVSAPAVRKLLDDFEHRVLLQIADANPAVVNESTKSIEGTPSLDLERVLARREPWPTVAPLSLKAARELWVAAQKEAEYSSTLDADDALMLCPKLMLDCASDGEVLGIFPARLFNVVAAHISRVAPSSEPSFSNLTAAVARTLARYAPLAENAVEIAIAAQDGGAAAAVSKLMRVVVRHGGGAAAAAAVVTAAAAALRQERLALPRVSAREGPHNDVVAGLTAAATSDGSHP